MDDDGVADDLEAAAIGAIGGSARRAPRGRRRRRRDRRRRGGERADGGDDDGALDRASKRRPRSVCCAIALAAVLLVAANLALAALPSGASRDRGAAVDVRYAGYTLLLVVILYAGLNTACPVFLVAHLGRRFVLGRTLGLGYVEWPYDREEILAWRVG